MIQNTIEIINNDRLKTFASYNLLKTMRAGVLVLGPLLAKYKVAKVSLPGGCAIGNRPIDIHLLGLEKLGVNFTIENGFVYGEVKNKLIGNTINFPLIETPFSSKNFLKFSCKFFRALT